MPFEPKIVAYLCTWCSYTGADTAGIARLKSPANLRAIRVPCSGRVSPELILRTFDQGADGVLVLGCHIGECHYDSGNHRTAKRIPVLSALLTFAGLEPDRLRLDWVSASEGERFSRIVNEFTETVRALGPIRWRVSDGRAAIQMASGLTDLEHLLQLADEKPEPVGFDVRVNHTNWESLTQAIRSTARDLLQNHAVDVVIGYEIGTGGRTRPAFIRQSEQAERLIWNQDCTHNLFLYVEDTLRRQCSVGASNSVVGIVAKPCDLRAINVLLTENRFERQQVHIIGVTCDGIRKGAGATKPEPAERWTLQDRCITCEQHTPALYDTLIGAPSTAAYPTPTPSPAAITTKAVNVLESLQPEERLEFWLSQFDRCIRCYACRQVCPMCYCPTCLFERDDSLWVGMRIGLNEKRTFHLGRAYHLAGRCIGCDECTRVCPMDIPVNLLNRKLAQEIEQLFAFRAGVEPKPSPILTVLGGEERSA